MCGICGCSDDSAPKIIDLQKDQVHSHDHEHNHNHHHHDHSHAHDHHHHDHSHAHDHEHVHANDNGHSHSRTIRLEAKLLAKNDERAQWNRGWFAGRGVTAINIVSSPGSGKTTLLERTIRDLAAEIDIQVIEGDQATTMDAERIRGAGGKVVQINTGAGCHLEADMVARAVQSLDPPAGSLLIIENVGNLVCPALFDLGEQTRVLVASVVEGEDKPLKYPHMFRSANLVLLNKIDLLPYVEFSVEQFLANVKQVNPKATVLQLSAKSGAGLESWHAWLRALSPASLAST